MFLMQRFFRQPVALRGVFVDVGAFDGHTHSNTKTFEEAFKWRGICIEPSPPNFGDLTQRRPRCTNYNAAVCLKPGTTLVYGEVGFIFCVRLPALVPSHRATYVSGRKCQPKAQHRATWVHLPNGVPSCVRPTCSVREGVWLHAHRFAQH